MLPSMQDTRDVTGTSHAALVDPEVVLSAEANAVEVSDSDKGLQDKAARKDDKVISLASTLRHLGSLPPAAPDASVATPRPRSAAGGKMPRCRGDTALHTAAANGQEPTVRLLIKLGSDLESFSDSDGFTPLMRCCEYDQLECALVLLEQGASVAALDKKGHTPLHWSMMYSERITEVLLARGAKPCSWNCLKCKANVRKWGNRAGQSGTTSAADADSSQPSPKKGDGSGSQRASETPRRSMPAAPPQPVDRSKLSNAELDRLDIATAKFTVSRDPDDPNWIAFSSSEGERYRRVQPAPPSFIECEEARRPEEGRPSPFACCAKNRCCESTAAVQPPLLCTHRCRAATVAVQLADKPPARSDPSPAAPWLPMSVCPEMLQVFEEMVRHALVVQPELDYPLELPPFLCLLLPLSCSPPSSPSSSHSRPRAVCAARAPRRCEGQRRPSARNGLDGESRVPPPLMDCQGLHPLR